MHWKRERNKVKKSDSFCKSECVECKWWKVYRCCIICRVFQRLFHKMGILWEPQLECGCHVSLKIHFLPLSIRPNFFGSALWVYLTSKGGGGFCAFKIRYFSVCYTDRWAAVASCAIISLKNEAVSAMQCWLWVSLHLVLQPPWTVADFQGLNCLVAPCIKYSSFDTNWLPSS